MKKFGLYFLATALLVGGTTYVARAEEDDDKEEAVAESAIPPPVKATLNTIAPGAKFKSAVLEEEDEAKQYEITVTTTDGKEIEVMILTDGQFVETEEQVKEAGLPKGVADTLKEVLPNGKTIELEKKMVVVYEVKREVGEKTYEVMLDGSGKIIKIESEGEEGEEEEDEKDEKNEKGEEHEKAEAKEKAKK